MTASWILGRKVFRPSFRCPKYTRLVRSTAVISRDGSIQREHPVHPRWPIDPSGKWRPASEPPADPGVGVSHPGVRGHPGGAAAFDVISSPDRLVSTLPSPRLARRISRAKRKRSRAVENTPPCPPPPPLAPPLSSSP